MIGDSITAGSSSALKAALAGAGFTDVTIEAEPSRRIEVGGGSDPRSGMQALETLLAKGASPDVWVVALGTNDVGKYPKASDYSDLVDRFLARLPKGPLLWIDIYRRDYLDDTKVFNAVLRDRLARRGDASVVSWFDLASQRNQKILQADRLHPNEAGRKVFADLVTNGVLALA
jgi:lysophospholipase L1-like esterase